LHPTAGRELGTHIDQGGLDVVSGIAHGGGAVGQPGIFETLQCRVQKLVNHRLRLAALGHLRGRWSGSRQVAFMLSGCGVANRRDCRQANAQKKDPCIHHSLPASTH
jgi:hypothetical protein